MRGRVSAPKEWSLQMSASKDEPLHASGKKLRGQGEDVGSEQLPRRWVDLIHHLNEQERRGLQQASIRKRSRRSRCRRAQLSNEL